MVYLDVFYVKICISNLYIFDNLKGWICKRINKYGTQ